MARPKKTQAMAQAEPVAHPVDTVLERLQAAGIPTSEWLLDLNSSLTTPYDFAVDGIWKLPSRLFAFPIQVSRFDGVNERVLTLRHPLLSDHPFVQHVEAALGVKLAPAERVDTWSHACDLMAKHWQELMATRHFTTDDDIARSVAFRLSSAYDSDLTVQTARTILGMIGAAEPTDGVQLLCKFAKPLSLTDEDKVVRWPINGRERMTGDEQAWAFLIGLERGWFAYKGQHLEWTQMGRDLYAAGPDALFIQSEGGQTAFAF